MAVVIWPPGVPPSVARDDVMEGMMLVRRRRGAIDAKEEMPDAELSAQEQDCVTGKLSRTTRRHG